MDEDFKTVRGCQLISWKALLDVSLYSFSCITRSVGAYCSPAVFKGQSNRLLELWIPWLSGAKNATAQGK